jgi:hypothetical protein
MREQSLPASPEQTIDARKHLHRLAFDVRVAGAFGRLPA